MIKDVWHETLVFNTEKRLYHVFNRFTKNNLTNYFTMFSTL